jgi:antitoxin component YwqK of YwqJK toxin-antitoxin module
MKKSLLFPLFVACLLLSALQFSAQPGLVWPQGEAGKDFNLTDAKGKRQGVWIRVHASKPSVLYYKGQFKDGVPTGVWEWYYPTGKLMTIMTHVKGDEITDNVNYYDDGKSKMSEGRFVKKKIDGKEKRCREGQWKMYDSSGILRSDELYSDSLLTGLSKYYYDNGAIASMIQFNQGVKNGPFTDYHENGKKKREGTYEADSFEGKLKQWFENGTLEIEGQYQKGQQFGTWYYYEMNGTLKMAVLYKNGTEVKRQYQEGTYTDYYDSGIPKCEYTWENGKRTGPFVEWYDQGQFVQVEGTKEDMEVGIMMREKLEGQRKKCEGDYIDDKLEGNITYYDEKGNITKIEVWSDGVLTSTRSGKK